MIADVEIWKLLGQGGFALALLFLIYKLGVRGVAAIDRVGLRMEGFAAVVNDHTKTDLAAHSEVRRDVATVGRDVMGAIGSLREDVAVLDARQEQMRLDWADQMTPVTAQRYQDARDERDERSPTHLRAQTSRPTPIPERPSTGEYSVVRPVSEREVTRGNRRPR